MMNDALLRRRRVLGFLIQSAHDLHVSPIVKYSALSLFADRFYPSLSRKGMDKENWLLDPMRESNLQLFALASVWISCKVATYVITVPVQRWEFPVLPWVVLVTSCKEQDIVGRVRIILRHVFEP
nr:cyclin-J18 isoform X1 [Ipomoea batatas]